MNSTSHGHSQFDVRRIKLNLREVGQLFNTMDPSPFQEKEQDRDAEEFIVSWALNRLRYASKSDGYCI